MPAAMSHLASGGWAGEDSTPCRSRSAASKRVVHLVEHHRPGPTEAAAAGSPGPGRRGRRRRRRRAEATEVRAGSRLESAATDRPAGTQGTPVTARHPGRSPRRPVPTSKVAYQAPGSASRVSGDSPSPLPGSVVGPVEERRRRRGPGRPPARAGWRTSGAPRRPAAGRDRARRRRPAERSPPGPEPRRAGAGGPMDADPGTLATGPTRSSATAAPSGRHRHPMPVP